MRNILTYKIPFWPVFAFFLAGAGAFFYLNQETANRSLSFLDFSNGNDEISFEYGPRPELGGTKFFEETKQKFLQNKTDFIEADLSSMILRVYKGGQIAREAKIMAKGREGSWWETPAGLYRVELKTKNHFSGFAQVYQPWSLVFQGNFFIHGWPYYPGGKPVASTYSGGCIRLSNEDAEAVYNLASVGMPVLVYEKDFGADNFIYTEKIAEIPSRAYLAADLKNNFVFAEKNKDEILPIASLAKLMTALISTEYINLEKSITIRDSMLISTSRPRLESGETYLLYNLLFPLLLESSNEAAQAVGSYLGLERSRDLMNKKAAALGMVKTKFEDPSGASEKNVSTAEDMFSLAKYLYNNRNFILRITAGRLTVSEYGSPGFSNLKNFNLFEGDPRFAGGKIGKGGGDYETYLGVFNISVNGENRPVAIIVLGSEAGLKENVQKILDYIGGKYAE